MTHYYTDNSSLDSQKTKIKFHYRDYLITYISDIGVFSKERIDYGSRVLLENITLDNVHSLLDVGCGYGTLGIALKYAYPAIHVEMVDVNKRAVDLANESIDYNYLNDILAYESNAYENVSHTFDMIVSNPPIRAGKKVVFQILEEAYQYLEEAGELWIVIQKKQGAPSAQKKMKDVFGNCEIIKRDKGYYILRAIK
ncbi:MAG: class I SAM-dependent methyltransferase [Erysipelotrichaceae bacterium]|nr:class I SAM-dependent methyltransferase [Erysipelotrichaceae bacterium]